MLFTRATLNAEVTAGGSGPPPCTVGTVTSQATGTNLSLFGTPVYFDNGAALAAGTYRLKNNGGCLKYGAGQNWTCHAYANGVVGWWLVGDTTSMMLGIPPGTIGFQRVPGSADLDIGSFTDFSLCDAANRALPAQDFTFAGGKLGIWLKDDIRILLSGVPGLISLLASRSQPEIVRASGRSASRPSPLARTSNEQEGEPANREQGRRRGGCEKSCGKSGTTWVANPPRQWWQIRHSGRLWVCPPSSCAMPRRP